ncbi:MAG: PASTA domain-containing protein [Anaerolineae bacterium]|nr:PASTA domain-containing protein [Chloroflexota bacterium]MBN8633747.1 PASTA domain-containing protein [Anaerolineae bacterium]
MSHLSKRHSVQVLLLVVSVLTSVWTVRGQGETVTVPDLTGLSVPVAAAQLNAAGLRLGGQEVIPWSESSSLPAGSISTQDVAAGQTATAGTAINVQVLASPNVTLIYDENDLTILNRTGQDLPFGGLSFEVADGAMPATFQATRWAGGLQNGRCAQVWSVVRYEAKAVDGCDGIANWLTTNNPGEHFWTQLNGVNRFRVLQNGVERGACASAAAGTTPITCSFYIPAPSSSDVTEYVYFAYTPGRLAIINQSPDRWMPLVGTQVINNNPNLTPPGQGVPIGDPALYLPVNPVADVTRLAPGQCVLFTDSTGLETDNLPQPCTVIARLDIGQQLIFWAADFNIVSVTDGQTRTCRAATADRLTICVMPR